MMHQRATFLAIFISIMPILSEAYTTVHPPTTPANPVVGDGIANVESIGSPSGTIDAYSSRRLLDVSMIIGTKEGGSRMVVRGMTFAIHDNEDGQRFKSSISMPGGQYPQFSRGLSKLTVVNDGSFVGMSGEQIVSPERSGCWELIWKDDAPAGSLVCGVRLPKPYSRNDATLPCGDVCLSFPVFNKNGLEFGRKRKRELQERYSQYKAEQEAAMERVQEAKNPLAKMMHYREAIAATEKCMLHKKPLEHVGSIPDTDRNILRLDDDIFLVTEGHVWQQDSSWGGKMLQPDPRTVLGTVSAAFSKENE